MTRRQLDRFLRALSERVPFHASLILTGGVAAGILGRVRPTEDIDFEARSRDRRRQEELERQIQATARETGTAVQYSEDIDRWSSITLPDHRSTARRWKAYGRLRVDVLHPLVLAVPKLARGTEDDLRDVVACFKKQRVSWRSAACTFGLAARRSPRSTALTLYARRVEYFFDRFGSRIWGSRFRSPDAQSLFRRHARRRSRINRRA
ncbi:MAG: nucleotidyl transferase AbiEii/AbiGii toxin family protein [Nitrospirae bacterium]|nr:nucleotidyl transferase AbiEii/AbiGii toxin family protein [Nitrospirota bacterium]